MSEFSSSSTSNSTKYRLYSDSVGTPQSAWDFDANGIGWDKPGYVWAYLRQHIGPTPKVGDHVTAVDEDGDWVAGTIVELRLPSAHVRIEHASWDIS